ncbi:MAG: dTDP-4-dehydrorhamnose 3,5-epimerase [Woeseia sp.]
MKIEKTPLADLYTIQPRIYKDDRGYFFESYNEDRFFSAIGLRPNFVQDNCSVSECGVIRGLHYQIDQPQGKLVRVTAGTILDVVVDLRRSSSTFGNWFTIELSSENNTALWVPVGFAHGFLVVSDSARVHYKVTDFYNPNGERTIAWNDARLGIVWPINRSPILSPKDRVGRSLDEADVFP